MSFGSIPLSTQASIRVNASAYKSFEVAVGKHTELRLADADDSDPAAELSLHDQLHQRLRH